MKAVAAMEGVDVGVQAQPIAALPSEGAPNTTHPTIVHVRAHFHASVPAAILPLPPPFISIT